MDLVTPLLDNANWRVKEQLRPPHPSKGDEAVEKWNHRGRARSPSRAPCVYGSNKNPPPPPPLQLLILPLQRIFLGRHIEWDPTSLALPSLLQV